MRPYKLLTLLFVLISNIAFGHQDFWMTKDFGNVKVRIKTGFRYEEIKKSWIIGELASRLCKKMNFIQPVFIDFNHFYVGDCDPDYFVSFDDGSIISTDEAGKPKAFLKQNSLVIREVSRIFKPSITLNLLEYSIMNIAKIKSAQKAVEYNQNFCNWKIKSIDTGIIKTIASGILSNRVQEILLIKIYREEMEIHESPIRISYFYQNNKYHVFYNDYIVKDSVLLVVDNIYQFENLSARESIIFVTDSSFFFIQGVIDPQASQKKIVNHIYENFQPFKISKLGSHKIVLVFWDYFNLEERERKERIVLYKIDTEELIQDLDNRLSEK